MKHAHLLFLLILQSLLLSHFAFADVEPPVDPGGPSGGGSSLCPYMNTTPCFFNGVSGVVVNPTSANCSCIFPQTLKSCVTPGVTCI